MLIASGYPLSMQVDETAGKLILDELRENGLKVRVGISVEAFDGNASVTGAHLSDGTRTSCDLILQINTARPHPLMRPGIRHKTKSSCPVDSLNCPSVEFIVIFSAFHSTP